MMVQILLKHHCLPLSLIEWGIQIVGPIGEKDCSQNITLFIFFFKTTNSLESYENITNCTVL